MKRCARCNTFKNLEDFYKDKTITGRDYTCKDCRKLYEMATKQSKKYYQKNKEKIKAKVKEYKQSTRGKVVINNSNNKRRSKYKITDITTDWLQDFKKEATHCKLCECELNEISFHPQKRHLDHIVPLNIGGTHTMNNVRYLCQTCNLQRYKKGQDLENAKK